MADYLVYWKSYWEEVADPAEISIDWHTSHDSFYEEVQAGDVIWVVTSGGPAREHEWRLLYTFSVADKRGAGAERPGYRYLILGDEEKAVLFNVDEQTDLAWLLRDFEFASGKAIQLSGRLIAQALQSPRKLDGMDAVKFRVLARQLATMK